MVGCCVQPLGRIATLLVQVSVHVWSVWILMKMDHLEDSFDLLAPLPKFLAWKSGGVKFWTNSMSAYILVFFKASFCKDLQSPSAFIPFHSHSIKPWVLGWVSNTSEQNLRFKKFREIVLHSFLWVNFQSPVVWQHLNRIYTSYIH